MKRRLTKKAFKLALKGYPTKIRLKGKYNAILHELKIIGILIKKMDNRSYLEIAAIGIEIHLHIMNCKNILSKPKPKRLKGFKEKGTEIFLNKKIT